jgi:hypothetical protein
VIIAQDSREISHYLASKVDEAVMYETGKRQVKHSHRITAKR